MSEKEYQQVTSYTRAVVLFGFFLGATLAQLLVSFASIEYFYLNVIALVNKCIGFFISLFLPMPKRTFFFYAGKENQESESLPNPIVKPETSKSLLEMSEQSHSNKAVSFFLIVLLFFLK